MTERPRPIPLTEHPLYQVLLGDDGRENLLMQRDNTELLKTTLLELVPSTERERLERAIIFADFVHQGQFRRDKRTPYINHVLRMAHREMHDVVKGKREFSLLDMMTILLHDTEEDFLDKIEPDRGKAHAQFKMLFNETFQEEILAPELFANIQALNKNKPNGERKTKQEYFEGITHRKLWKVKLNDRGDSLSGDIAFARTAGLNEKTREQIKQSIHKAHEVIEWGERDEPEETQKLRDLIGFAQLVIALPSHRKDIPHPRQNYR